jgi:hypothetical protein
MTIALRISVARLWLPIVLVLLTLLFYDRLLFSGLVLARGDTFAYFYPYWEARNAALMAGRLPLWSPDLFMGVPLLANSQLGTFYPPNWLVAPLSPIDGIRLSIAMHGGWMLTGAYLLARRAVGLPQAAALLTAVVFAFGGTMSARVEQINQFQGLSWLPWLLLLLHFISAQPPTASRAFGSVGAVVGLLSLALALQFFTGHTQTSFISGVALALYALCSPRRWRMLLALGMAGLVALLLALPQLLPTLELTSVSHRSGGMNANEATAFSLNPFLTARGLLPGYDQPIFAEYIAYPGVIALCLVLVGIFAPRIGEAPVSGWRGILQDRRLPWLVLAFIGLFFAFGQYNPIYWWLANLPGFNLFRVPARWLVLTAIGVAMLAGLGAQALPALRLRRRVLLTGLALVIVGGLAAAALVLTGRNPEPVPATPPTDSTLLGWALALLAGVAVLWVGGKRNLPLRALIVLLVVAELWLAARALPYNQLVPRDMVDGQRFTVSQLRAFNQDDLPPARLLSISNLLFDPGDRAALEARFAGLDMSAAEVRTALVAVKQQEVVAANLPLLWGIPTIDGFDGGVLPTRYYTAFSSLLLPAESMRTLDGRLREMLALESCRGTCLPQMRWLNLTHTRYLLTDKIFDVWHEGAAYDTTFAYAAPFSALPARFYPAFLATHLDLLVASSEDIGTLPDLRLYAADGEMLVLPATSGEAGEALRDGARIVRYALPAPTNVEQLFINWEQSVAELRAVTAVDMRSSVFQQAAFFNWRRVLSSDIEVYENSAVFPRAFTVYRTDVRPDSEEGTESALTVMRQPDFDPQALVTLNLADPSLAVTVNGGSGEARIARYTAEQVVLTVESSAAGYLLLTDAWYPGWEARVNGSPVPVARADVMFRAVPVPAGTSEVVFDYRPSWLGLLPLWGVLWAGMVLFTGLRLKG